MKALLIVAVACSGACEYRDEAKTVVLQNPCYALRDGTSTVVRAQVRNDASDPILGIDVTWTTLPPDVVTNDQASSVTAVADVDALAARGIASTNVSLKAAPKEAGRVGDVTATVVVGGSVASAAAALWYVKDGSGGCPASSIDAGLVDAGAVDAPPPDVMLATPDATPSDASPTTTVDAS